jgi:acetoin utilization deacetylase AcuC-like enzyme
VDRIKVINKILESPHFAGLQRQLAPLGKEEDILRAHTQEHLRHILSMSPEEGVEYVDPDTVMSPGTLEAALRAVGAATAAVDAVFAGQADNAFCAMRPPGHHAESRKPMGFCLFNQVAIAAHYARSRYDAERVAVVDFDVHHGNGTQEIFWEDSEVLYVSLHGDPAGHYPHFTGAADETGGGPGAGTTRNLPLPDGTGDDAYLEALGEAMAAVDAFDPATLVVSAGFDTFAGDPIGAFAVTTAGFRRVGAALAAAGRPAAVVQEGGYAVDALGANAVALLAGLQGTD